MELVPLYWQSKFSQFTNTRVALKQNAAVASVGVNQKNQRISTSTPLNLCQNMI